MKYKNFFLILISVVLTISICEFIMAFLNYSRYENEKQLFAYEWKKIIHENNLKPFVSPKNFYSNKLISNNILPLSQISNTKILLCNEKSWITIKTDKYGFNNSNNIYKNKIDYVVLGDSFAMGFCVNTENNFVSNLNNLSSLNGLNLGQGGNGPLLSFASFKEFGLSHKPKFVIHLIYENDINDLENELSNSFLNINYLKNDNLQYLQSNQEIVDKLLREDPKLDVNYIYNKRLIYYDKIKKNILIKTYKLGNLREYLSLVRKSKLQNNYDKIFEIVKIIKNYLKTKDINYFIIVMTDPNKKTTLKEQNLKNFLTNLKDEKIMYNDANNFFKNLKIKNYWQGHYNELGYEILAKNFYEKNKLLFKKIKK